MPTEQECKHMLFNIGLKLGVSPNLISTRLLTKLDKEDMLNGLLPLDALETGVKIWMKEGMPDTANGKNEPYRPLTGKRYSGYGKS
jgi:hypothetical protein